MLDPRALEALQAESDVLTARLRGRRVKPRPKPKRRTQPKPVPAAFRVRHAQKPQRRLKPARSSPQLNPQRRPSNQVVTPRLLQPALSSPQLPRARARARRRRRPAAPPQGPQVPQVDENAGPVTPPRGRRRRRPLRCPGSPRTVIRAEAAAKAERWHALGGEQFETSPRLMDEADLRALAELRGDTHVAERFAEWRASSPRAGQSSPRMSPRIGGRLPRL